MLPSEHAMLNTCCDRIASLPIKDHNFVLRTKDKTRRYVYVHLSARQKSYLRQLHDRLVKQGLAEAVTP